MFHFIPVALRERVLLRGGHIVTFHSDNGHRGVVVAVVIELVCLHPQCMQFSHHQRVSFSI